MDNTSSENLPEATSTPKNVRPQQEELPLPDEDNNDYVTGLKLVIIVATVALILILLLLDTMVISTAIPRITDEFNSLADVGWYASAYQVGSAAPQPLAGNLYSLFSTKVRDLCMFDNTITDRSRHSGRF